MLKVFVIREKRILENVVQFLNSNWEAMARSGKCLTVECKEEKAKRSNEANRYYWQLLHQVEEQAWVEGRQYSSEVWHEAAKRRFLGLVDLPGGASMGISTTTLSTREFAEYVEKVTAWAALELGVQFESNETPLGRTA